MRGLVTLRCPKRCRLGVVVVVANAPQVLIKRRFLLQVDQRGTRGSDEYVGPVPLDSPGAQVVGCRHSVDEPLWPHLSELQDVVKQVRRGDTRSGVDFVITPTHQTL